MLKNATRQKPVQVICRGCGEIYVSFVPVKSAILHYNACGPDVWHTSWRWHDPGPDESDEKGDRVPCSEKPGKNWRVTRTVPMPG